MKLQAVCLTLIDYPMTMSCAETFGGSKLKIVLESTVSASCSENMTV